MLLMITTALLVILPTCAQVTAAPWHGVTPLRSTRADVARLLGPPNLDGRYYEIDNFTVHIDYSDGPCQKGRSGWNVPRDTVVSLSLAPTQELKFATLKIDKKKYKKSQDAELPEVIYYTNEAEGVTISVSEGEVRNIYYTPAAKDAHLRCPSSTNP